MSDRPECFGVCWEPFGDSPCLTCGVRHECLDAIAKGLYPETVAKLMVGTQHPSTKAMSEALELKEEAVHAIAKYHDRLVALAAQKPEAAPAPPPPAPAAPVAPAPKTLDEVFKERSAEELARSEAARKAKEAEPAKPEAPPVQLPLPVVAAFPAPQPPPPPAPAVAAPPPEEPVKQSAAVQTPPEPVEPKAEAKKKTTKAKAKAKREPQAVASVPQKAGPAPSAAGPASTHKGAKKGAKHVTARVVTSAPKHASKPKKGQPRQWGPHKAAERWTREREKNPLVAALTPGCKLKREFDGELKEVKVGAGYYLYQGEKYPTLQSVTTACTGAREYPKQELDGGKRRKGTRKMSNWSASKFWKLKALASGKK